MAEQSAEGLLEGHPRQPPDDGVDEESSRKDLYDFMRRMLEALCVYGKFIAKSRGSLAALP